MMRGVRDAHKKIGLRRMIEQKFRKAGISPALPGPSQPDHGVEEEPFGHVHIDWKSLDSLFLVGHIVGYLSDF